jgi:hypothetical protein
VGLRRVAELAILRQEPEIHIPLPQSGLFPEAPAIRNRVDRLRPNLFEIADFGFNNCQSWICVSPTLGGWSLPPVCAYYRAAGCADPTEEPEPEPPIQPPGVEEPSIFVPNRTNQGRVPGCRYFVLIRHVQPGIDGGIVAGLWDRRGDFDGLIVPVYGPVVGMTLRPFGQETLIYIHCGGVGMFNAASFPQFNGGFGVPIASIPHVGGFRGLDAIRWRAFTIAWHQVKHQAVTSTFK